MKLEAEVQNRSTHPPLKLVHPANSLRTEAAPIKCDGRESAGRPTDSHIESAGRPTDSLTESVGKPADSLPSHFIGAASAMSDNLTLVL